MSNKPEESKLIAYLYGELSDKEKKEVEAYLSGDPNAKKELEELQEARSALSSLKDKEVDIPSFTFSTDTNIVVGQRRVIDVFWKRSLAIAASVVLVLFIGYLTNFNMSYTEKGFQVAFGSNEKGYDQLEVESMIAQAINKNNEKVSQEMLNAEVDFKRLFDENMDNMKTTLVGQGNTGDIDQKLLSQKREFLELFKNMLESSELDQQKNLEEALVDFAVYLDVQRQNDLEVIQTRINSIEANAERNHFQTNRILSNLMPTSEESNHY